MGSARGAPHHAKPHGPAGPFGAHPEIVADDGESPEGGGSLFGRSRRAPAWTLPEVAPQTDPHGTVELAVRLDGTGRRARRHGPGPEFVERVLHVLGVDGSGLGECGGREGVVGDAIDLPRVARRFASGSDIT